LVALTVTGIIAGGGVLCLLLARWVRGSRCLAVLVLASYGVSVALTLGLYLVSAYRLPVLATVQFVPGFWRLAYDAPLYHVNGARIAEALRSGAELPQVKFGAVPYLVDNYEFFYFVGAVYWVFGTHPLYVPLLNSMFWATIAVLSYSLARRLGGEEAGRIAAVLVGFWPSHFIWSSQILKDTLMIFLSVLALSLLIEVLEGRRWVALAAAMALVPTVFFLGRVRYYVAALLIVAAVGSLWLTLALRVRELRWRRLLRAFGLTALLWVPFLAARFADTGWLPLLMAGSTDPSRVFSQADSYLRAPKAEGQAGESTANELRAPESKEAEAPRPNVLELLGRGSMNLARETYNFGNVDDRRNAFASARVGGASRFATDVRFRDVRDRVAFLPTGLGYALYAPFPWHWFSATGDTGEFKAFSAVEALLMMALTPSLFLGVVRAVRSKRMDAWTILIFGALTMAALALTVGNLGTLFRLRLQALIPLFVVAAAFGMPNVRLRPLLDRLRS